MPNQDAQAFLAVADAPVMVAAVADGHGHFRHFRAERGAQLAVAQACQCAAQMGRRLDALGSNAEREALATGTLVPSVVEAWLRAVAADHAETPFTPSEEAIRAIADDDPVIAYGATLLLALLAGRWVLVAQIGDGDVVALRADGVADVPVPTDPTLDGHYTTSLCQAAAVDSFRITLIDQSSTPLVALLLATDGFGNAQLSDPWPPAVGADVVSMLRSHGIPWVQEQLPIWVERCASKEGSGDDTTVVLVVRLP
jgi:serine/threonine protein phosphatase PrpC